MYCSINNQRARQKRLFLRVNKLRPIKLPLLKLYDWLEPFRSKSHCLQSLIVQVMPDSRCRWIGRFGFNYILSGICRDKYSEYIFSPPPINSRSHINSAHAFCKKHRPFARSYDANVALFWRFFSRISGWVSSFRASSSQPDKKCKYRDKRCKFEDTGLQITL
jgi:hypothetical protein